MRSLITFFSSASLKEGIEKGDSEKTIQDFTKAIEYFSRL